MFLFRHRRFISCAPIKRPSGLFDRTEIYRPVSAWHKYNVVSVHGYHLIVTVQSMWDVGCTVRLSDAHICAPLLNLSMAQAPTPTAVIRPAHVRRLFKNMLFAIASASFASFTLGNGLFGIGLPKNLQSGSHPSFTLITSKRSAGTDLLTRSLCIPSRSVIQCHLLPLHRHLNRPGYSPLSAEAPGPFASAI